MQHSRHTKFPHPYSTGLSSRPMHIVQSMSLFVCVLGEGGSVGEKRDAGDMASSLDARALAVLKLGLPGFNLALPPRVSSDLKWWQT